MTGAFSTNVGSFVREGVGMYSTSLRTADCLYIRHRGNIDVCR